MLREDSETTKLWWGNSLRPHALKWLTNLGLLIFHVSHLLAEEVKLSGKPVHINEDQQYFRSPMKLTYLPKISILDWSEKYATYFWGQSFYVFMVKRKLTYVLLYNHFDDNNLSSV